MIDDVSELSALLRVACAVHLVLDRIDAGEVLPPAVAAL